MREKFVGSMYTVCRKWKEQSVRCTRALSMAIVLMMAVPRAVRG